MKALAVLWVAVAAMRPRISASGAKRTFTSPPIASLPGLSVRQCAECTAPQMGQGNCLSKLADLGRAPDTVVLSLALPVALFKSGLIQCFTNGLRQPRERKHQNIFGLYKGRGPQN